MQFPSVINDGYERLRREMFGSLVIDKPEGAGVFLDDALKGDTPITLPLVRVGSHELVVSKSGYNDYTESVEIEPGVVRQLERLAHPAEGQVVVGHAGRRAGRRDRRCRRRRRLPAATREEPPQNRSRFPNRPRRRRIERCARASAVDAFDRGAGIALSRGEDTAVERVRDDAMVKSGKGDS